MPRMIASPQRRRGVLWSALAVAAAMWSIAPAAGADPAPPPARGGADRPHPDAAKINQTNSRVIHAGPGTPLTGAIHVPPAQAKKGK
jgi:hypothetical protein